MGRPVTGVAQQTQCANALPDGLLRSALQLEWYAVRAPSSLALATRRELPGLAYCSVLFGCGGLCSRLRILDSIPCAYFVCLYLYHLCSATPLECLIHTWVYAASEIHRARC